MNSARSIPHDEFRTMNHDRAGRDALMEITSRPDLIFVRGHGAWLYDEDGKRHLDFIQGWAVNCLGHGHPAIIEALTRQARELINPSPAFNNRPAIELARRIVGASCFDRVFFANSGAEANEGAIKLARKWGQLHRRGAYKIITFDHAFHGRTLATMSASGKPGWDTQFAPQVAGFPKANLNDLASVEALVDDETVAVMLEPVQGEAGVIPARFRFLRDLRELTRQRSLLLIVDEVQTGMARTGLLFAYQHAGIEPDIMTLGKGIGGGVPLSALCATAGVSCFEHGDQGGTYCGNPLTAAVGVAIFDILSTPEFLDTVHARSRQLKAGLEALSHKWGMRGERGLGLLRALVMDRDDGPALVEAARNRAPEGLLINAPRPNLIRFMPALNVTAEEIDTMLGWLDELVARVRR